MDTLTKAQRSERMSRIRGKDTVPEMLVRRLVHGLGYRYRLHRKDLPGKPDLVFGPRRCAIFVHGCFWHGHACKLGRTPKSNVTFWVEKIAGNRARDASCVAKLRRAGWRVLTIWQCQIGDDARLGARIGKFLGAAG